MPVLSSGEDDDEGAVPGAICFLNAAQYALHPPLIWTDFEFLRGRDCRSLVVAGAGSKCSSVAAEWSERSFVFVVVVWRDFAGVRLEGAAETERESRKLKRMLGPNPNPSLLVTVRAVLKSAERGKEEFSRVST